VHFDDRLDQKLSSSSIQQVVLWLVRALWPETCLGSRLLLEEVGGEMKASRSRSLLGVAVLAFAAWVCPTPSFVLVPAPARADINQDAYYYAAAGVDPDQIRNQMIDQTGICMPTGCIGLLLGYPGSFLCGRRLGLWNRHHHRKLGGPLPSAGGRRAEILRRGRQRFTP